MGFYIWAAFLFVVVLAVLLFADARHSSRTNEVRRVESGGGVPPRLARLSPGELAGLCVRLLSRLGYSMLTQEMDGRVVEVRGVDPQPIRGNLLLLRAFTATDLVDEPEVQSTLDAMRDQSVNKALLVGLAGFSGEAELRAAGNPVELVDAQMFDRLLDEFLPELGQPGLARPFKASVPGAQPQANGDPSTPSA